MCECEAMFRDIPSHWTTTPLGSHHKQPQAASNGVLSDSLKYLFMYNLDSRVSAFDHNNIRLLQQLTELFLNGWQFKP